MRLRLDTLVAHAPERWEFDAECTLAEFARDNAGDDEMSEFAAQLAALPLGGVTYWNSGAGGVTRFTRID